MKLIINNLRKKYAFFWGKFRCIGRYLFQALFSTTSTSVFFDVNALNGMFFDIIIKYKNYL